MYDPKIHWHTQARIWLNRSRKDDVRISFTRNFRANHLRSNLHLGAEAQFIHHAVQTHQQRFVLQFQRPCPQLQSFHLLFQGVDVNTLMIDLTEKLVLFLVNIRVPRTVAIRHGLGIRLDLSQVLFHLVLLSFQMIPLRSNYGSVQSIGTKGGDLP